MMKKEIKNIKEIRFEKLHHLGNDFITVDFFDDPSSFYKIFTEKKVKKLCDRHFGVGADGVVAFLPPSSDKFDFKMEIINSDGSFAMMCGNGLACLAMYAVKNRLLRKKYVEKTPLRVETRGGERIPSVREIRGKYMVSIDMGKAGTKPEEVPFLAEAMPRNFKSGPAFMIPYKFGGFDARINLVSMGNPHCVIFLRKPLSRDEFLELGPMIENHRLFPEKTNVEFVTLRATNELDMMVWERGAGATLACGTGASAVAYAAFLNGFAGRRVRINLPGGSLSAEIKKDGHVILNCRPLCVFEGLI
ncbi:MAG TPA: diaminopimelate epimerase [Candidatus Wallbacteria bacterium]|nr:diaminopimelate epimerase [Candidatus Wallbacteria bacterium]